MADMTFFQAAEHLLSMREEILTSAWQTLVMMGIAIPTATVLGTILGVAVFATHDQALYYCPKLHKALDNAVNLMRAFPFVVLMLAVSPLTKWVINSSIGPLAAAFVLSISGVFYFARLVEQNLREVPRGIIEAATSMGTTPFAIIIHVLLNEARSGIVLSITVLSIGLLSYSAAAGMIGGGGLGDLAVRYGYYRFQTDVMVFIVIVLVLIVILMQSLGNFIARKLDKR